MRIVKRVVIAIVAVVIVLAVVAFFLPRHATTSRSIDIAAGPDIIFPIVSDLRRFNEWSPWYDRDPAATYTFTGPTDGVGQTMNWQSEVPEVGSGSMTIERIVERKEVEVAIHFAGSGESTGLIELESESAATTVTWSFDTDTGFNPAARYFGLMIDGVVGPDYEKGLAKLKALVETPPPAAN